MRIPAWVRSAKLRLGNRTNGREISLQTLRREDVGTYLTVWVDKPQETEVLLELGMEARLTCAHSLVEETVNQVAVERGPLVYCMEGMDAPVETIDDLFIPSDISLQPELFEIGGRTVTALTGTFLKKRTDGKEGYDRQALYQDYVDRGYEKIKGRMIPYFAWDNRGMDEMRIWMPVTDVRSL